MHDALLVRSTQGTGRLQRDVHEGRGAQRVPRHVGLQVHALQPFHRDELLAVVRVDFVDRADVRMAQQRDRGGFAGKATGSIRIRREFVRQELQRHLAWQARVLGLVDDAHPARPELAGDPIVADDRVAHAASAVVVPRGTCSTRP